MPLVGVGIRAEHYAGEVQFVMKEPGDPYGRRFLVTISTELLDAAAPSAHDGKQMLAWVERHRPELEQIASEKHDRGVRLRLMLNDWFTKYPVPFEP